MQRQEGQSTGETPPYLSKSVMVNGQPVTLYSVNGITWLSSTEELHEVMDRLDNTRIRLHDPKGEATPLAPKPTAARYRLRGPKSRPILEQEGRRIAGTAITEDPVTRPQYRLDIDLDGSDEGEGSPSSKTPKLARKGQKQGDKPSSMPAPAPEQGCVKLMPAAKTTAPKTTQKEPLKKGAKVPAKVKSKVQVKPPASTATVAAMKSLKKVKEQGKAARAAKPSPKKVVSKGSASRASSAVKGTGRKPAAGKSKPVSKRTPIKKSVKRR